jgi:osmotically-inducible protein OsmY
MGVSFGATLIVLASFCGSQISAQQTGAPASRLLDSITVTAKKVVSDEQVTTDVATALHADPYILDAHITITTKNGVVTLHGLALDNWDVQQMKRIAKKMPGVRKVINDLDVVMTGD